MHGTTVLLLTRWTPPKDWYISPVRPFFIWLRAAPHYSDLSCLARSVTFQLDVVAISGQASSWSLLNCLHLDWANMSRPAHSYQLRSTHLWPPCCALLLRPHQDGSTQDYRYHGFCFTNCSMPMKTRKEATSYWNLYLTDISMLLTLLSVTTLSASFPGETRPGGKTSSLHLGWH